MPWKECSVIDETMQFVARRLAGVLDPAIPASHHERLVHSGANFNSSRFPGT